MLRSILVAAALLATGTFSAHAQSGLTANQLASPWPGGAGARDNNPTVSARAAGYATGTATYRARVTLERRGATRAEAESAIDRAIAETIAIGGVEIRLNRKEVASILGEPSDAPANFVEQATIEVEARNRKAITDWTSKLSAGSPATTQTPVLTERMNDGDPAWDLATRNAMAAAERDARIAADASGGDLGRLVGVWVERVGVFDGAAHVLVTAEYLIARRR
jgi:hypothetical protein